MHSCRRKGKWAPWGCTFQTGVVLLKQSRIALFKHVRGGVGFLQQNTLIKYHGFRKTIGNDTFSDRKLMKRKQFRARVWIGVKWSWSYYVMWPRSDATAGGERKRETHTLSIKWKVWIGSSCHNLLWEREKLDLAAELPDWRCEGGGEAQLFDL